MTFQVLRRSSDCAILRPTREVLDPVVPQDDWYKAKSYIDTAVYRAGDQSELGLSRYCLGATVIAATATILSDIWLANALWLGRKSDAMAAEETGLPAET